MLHGFNGHKRQGNVGLGFAISHFTINDWTVSIPLNDSQAYDLVVEKHGVMRRVQVKTSRVISSSGKNFQVSISMSHPNEYRPLDPGSYDDLFILTNDGRRYLIPVNEMKNRATINVPGRYAQFEVRDQVPTLT